MNALELVERHYLLYFIVPVWTLAGADDWWMHRRSDIENTSGLEESLIHAAMLLEVGIPVTIGLFAEINALMIAVMIVALGVHEATAIWDVAYATERRRVTPTEQHMHSALESIPFLVVSFIVCMHWDQTIALFGFGSEAPRWTLAWKAQPLSGVQQLGVLAGVSLFLGLPYAEELFRCTKARLASFRPASIIAPNIGRDPQRGMSKTDQTPFHPIYVPSRVNPSASRDPRVGK